MPDGAADALVELGSEDAGPPDLGALDASQGDWGAPDLGSDQGAPSVNYMFATSQRYATNTLGATEADAFCNMAAAAGDPRLAGRHYVAFLSDDTSNAMDRLGDASGWIRLDERPFARSRDALVGVAAAPLYPPSIDEFGHDILAGVVMSDSDLYFATGVAYDGSLGESCDGWSSGSVGYTSGTVDGAGAGWHASETAPCSVAARLVCFGTDYDAPLPSLPTPTGATPALFASSVSSTVRAMGRDAIDAHCQTEASALGLTGTYMALLATTADSAASRLASSTGSRTRMDGVVVVDDVRSLIAGGRFIAPPGAVRGNGSRNDQVVAGGAYAFGAVGESHTTCANWGSADAAVNVAGMLGGRTSPNAYGRSILPCAFVSHVLCIAQ